MASKISTLDLGAIRKEYETALERLDFVAIREVVSELNNASEADKVKALPLYKQIYGDVFGLDRTIPNYDLAAYIASIKSASPMVPPPIPVPPPPVDAVSPLPVSIEAIEDVFVRFYNVNLAL